MEKELLQFEADGEFPFQFFIEKAVAEEDADELLLEGIASTTNTDHDKERMDINALRSMESAINKEGVPLRVEHQKDGEAIIGKVFKAWVDDRNQLHIRAILDKSHPVSIPLHRQMKEKGLKMGLSVGGLVKRAIREFSEAAGSTIKTFYDVSLQEVSVTPRPSNYDSWVMAKTGEKDVEKIKDYWNHLGLRREFLFENPQLDYCQSFAKAVPDKAWRKVESPTNINKENTNMDKEDEKDETTKSVTREEFGTLSKAVHTLSKLMADGFEKMGQIMTKAMDGDAKDQVNPDKNKDKVVGEDPKATSKGMETEAKETTNPNKDKKKEETQQTAKADDSGGDTDETETKTKASETEDTTEKKADEEDEYKMETVTRSIKSLENLQKRISKTEDEKETTDKTSKDDTDETTKNSETDETKEKASKEDTDETTKSGVHPLDAVVAMLTKTMEMLVEKYEKNGQRILGFEKSFIENIKNSPELQEVIQKSMKIPGQKKSLVMGVPYMVTKDGRRQSLINVPETVQKSLKTEDGKPMTFKEAYKKEYSSTVQQEQ